MFNKIRRKLANFKNTAIVFFPDNKFTITIVKIGNGHYTKEAEKRKITITGKVEAEAVLDPPRAPRNVSGSTKVMVVPVEDIEGNPKPFEQARKTVFDKVLHVRDGENRDFLVYCGVRHSDTNKGGEKAT